MAAYSAKTAVHKTLTAAAEDIVTLTAGYAEAEIYNRDAAGVIYARMDNVAAVSAADDTYVIGPGQALIVRESTLPGHTTIIRLISTVACPYSIRGL